MEHHGLLVGVKLGRESLYLALDDESCILMHLLEVAYSSTRVQIDVLLQWKRKNVQWGQWVEAIDNLEGGPAGSSVSSSIVGVLGDG